MRTAIITAIALLTSTASESLSAIPGGDVYRTLTLGQLQFEPRDAGFPAGRTMNLWELQNWPQLTDLRVSSTALGIEGAIALAQALAHNPTSLVHLNSRANEFGDTEAEYIGACGLVHHTHLQ